jgi:formylglycine-generating enzyme required for sulfatase activity
MGCTAGQDCGFFSLTNEPHSVTLSNFYIGKTEVTQAQWKAVMGADDPVLLELQQRSDLYGFLPGDDKPMISVCWDDITKPDGFLAKLNMQTGKNYRLPTEAEWEYAARGGQRSHDYKYSGSNILRDVAWYIYSTPPMVVVNGPEPVGTKAGNELGIHDMSGNVEEWVSDRSDFIYLFSPAYLSPATNPQGSSTGQNRMIRGGSWMSLGGSIDELQVSYHLRFSSPSTRSWDLGFRLASSSE